MYKCECGKEFDNPRSYQGHCGSCSVHKEGLRRRFEQVLSNELYMNTHRIKENLFLFGYKNRKCEYCGNTEWMGKKIPLELHHEDGDNTNNSLENLKIACPNCHALTNTYKSKNIANKRKKSGELV